MEKELLELFEAVKKSADAATSCDGGAEESQCLDALEQLKNFPVTYQLLISTQVESVFDISQNIPERKSRHFLLPLIDTWKGIVIKEANKDAKNGNLERIDSLKRASPSAESPRAEKVQKTSAVKVEKVSKAEPVEIKKVDRGVKPSSDKAYSSETVKTERKTEKAASAESVKVEKIAKEVKKPALNSSAPPKLTSMIKSNDTARDRVRVMLHEALSKVSQEADERFADYHWGGSTGAQKAKYRSLIFNLKDQKNPDFRERFCSETSRQRGWWTCQRRKWQAIRGRRRTKSLNKKPCLSVSVESLGSLPSSSHHDGFTFQTFQQLHHSSVSTLLSQPPYSPATPLLRLFWSNLRLQLSFYLGSPAPTNNRCLHIEPPLLMLISCDPLFAA
ncbi:hypothetical protein GBA52_006499 [Prunus armeniaca]|nr:hypothetical protein GBA52_006499 [Prunus armeniaca]